MGEITRILHLHAALVPYDLAVSVDCEHEMEAIPMQALIGELWVNRAADELGPAKLVTEYDAARVRFECPRCGRAATIRVLGRQLPEDIEREREEARRERRREQDRERRRRKREGAAP